MTITLTPDERVAVLNAIDNRERDLARAIAAYEVDRIETPVIASWREQLIHLRAVRARL